MELRIYKNSSNQLSNLLFLANPSIPARVPPPSGQLFQASGYTQFLHIAFMVVARQRQGYVIRCEPQTHWRRLNFSQCHFCIYHSAIGDKLEREELVQKYMNCIVNKASMYTLYYVDIVDSGIFQSRVYAYCILLTQLIVYSRLHCKMHLHFFC